MCQRRVGQNARMWGVTSMSRRGRRGVPLGALLCCLLLIVASACSDGDDGDAAPSTTTSSVTTVTTEGAPTNTDEPPVAGSLASATVAVRAACREFYDHDQRSFEELLKPEELAAQCDVPELEWRSDCHAERPAQFVPGDGGCAYLGGYLAVWHGQQTFEGGDAFEVGDDVWTVVPESD